MVSSKADEYAAELVRLIHGDDNPAGPGFRSEAFHSSISGRHRGTEQALNPGSFVIVDQTAGLAFNEGISIYLRFWPTTPAAENQTLISQSSDGEKQYALRLHEGRLIFSMGLNSEMEIASGLPILRCTWYEAIASYDPVSGQASLDVAPRDAVNGGDTPVSTNFGTGLRIDAGTVTLAAELDAYAAPSAFYNGKIDGPRLYARAFDLGDVTGDAAKLQEVRARWDFSLDIGTSIVTDVSGNEAHGRTRNRPMRAATGWNWKGEETAWPRVPQQYGAIHFHDDDLDDAEWQPSLEWRVPPDLRSGVYAFHLQTEEAEDFVPFVVRPAPSGPAARTVLLLPTFSYLAYANMGGVASHDERVREGNERLGIIGPAAAAYPQTPQDRYIVTQRLTSTYGRHSDGSGVCHSSRMRPLLNMRPKYHDPFLNGGRGTPHQFNADLHLVDWLTTRGYAFDVIADDDLHNEGATILERYDVVLTGSHPEYWSYEMIKATRTYLELGGHMMYMGGNGMYWVTQLDKESGHTIEIRRRGPATRVWEPEPGEDHLSASGELGGIWRFRGTPPQCWLGVGFTAQGLEVGRPYVRDPASFDPVVSWVFEGVEGDSIGDFPSLVNSHGAASFEIDRVDANLGMPAQTWLLASATGFSDFYQHAIEEVLLSDSAQGGATNPLVRADMALLRYPGGGAVFSTASIGWCGCLSYNEYDNNVSRVTANVLDKFLTETDRPQR